VKKIWPVLIIILLALLEAGTTSMLPMPFKLISPTALYLIIRASKIQNPAPWGLAIIAGLILETVSIFPRGAYILLFIVLVGFTYLISYRLFTHHSFFSNITAVAIGSFVMYSLLALLRYASFSMTKNILFSISEMQAFEVIFLGTLVNSGFLVLITLFYMLMARIFKLPQKLN